MSLTQAATVLASFITDQLELDLERNKKVNNGELTQYEADIEAEEWENVGGTVRPSVAVCVIRLFFLFVSFVCGFFFVSVACVRDHRKCFELNVAMMDGFTIAEI